jgi:integrase
MWQGKLVRESTKQGNDKVARQMEAAHRTSLAKGEVGIRERKLVPTLAEFAREQFLPWAEVTFAASRKTWLWYRNGIRRLLECQSVADCKLDEIAGGLVAEYVARRQFAGLEVSSINRELQVLRRLLHLAVEWGAVEHAIKIKMLSGERHRENVVLPEEEARYLAAAREPLCSIATILVDSGLRPEECFRSQWENIWFASGRHGVLLVPFGKTQAARRAIPLTPRVRTLLESRWEEQGRPKEGWVWPAPTFSGHLEASSLKKQHGRALRMSGVRPFVLYTLRHTFLTRLGESGCDAWTLARIAGHSSIGISARYVHPSEEAMFDAMSRLGGHKSGHTTELQSKLGGNSKLLTQ